MMNQNPMMGLGSWRQQMPSLQDLLNQSQAYRQKFAAMAPGGMPGGAPGVPGGQVGPTPPQDMGAPPPPSAPLAAPPMAGPQQSGNIMGPGGMEIDPLKLGYFPGAYR